MQKSESIKELATALAKAQGQLENASKSSTNPHFKSKYADLAEVINTVRPVFAEHGLSVMQCPSFESGIVSVETVVMHSSGEWMASTVSAPVSKQDAQGVGSAITYCRRYSLAAMAGIAQEDADAEQAITDPSATPAKQNLSDKRFADGLSAIRLGNYSASAMRKNCILTEQQEKLLAALETELAEAK